MIDPTRAPSEHDLVHADALLDALGRGEAPDAADDVAVMLAMWRAEVADEVPPVTTTAAVAAPRTTAPRTALPRTAAPGAETPGAETPGAETPGAETPGAETPGAETPGAGPATAPVSGGSASVGPVAAPSGSRRPPRRWRLALAAAATILGMAGGTAVAAATATPSSPLWPLAQFVFPDRSDRIAAEEALDRAREAAEDDRIDEATALLDEAERLIAEVDDATARERLRRELEQLRVLVGATIGPAVPPLPGRSEEPDPSPTPSSAPSGGSDEPTSDPLLPSPLLPSPLLPSPLLPSPLLPSPLLPTLGLSGL